MARNVQGRRTLPPPTQDQIIVKEFVEEDIALLKDGTLVQAIEVGACDMDAMSEGQQNWLLGRFQAFLIGLRFPIQIIIASEYQNITPWIEHLMEDVQGWEGKLSGISPDGTEREVLKRLRDRACERIEWVKRVHGLAKPQIQRYYLVLYVNPLPLKTSRRQLTEGLYQKAKEELARYRMYIMESLQDIGLSARILKEADLRAILSHFYKRQITPLHVTPKQAIFSLVYSPERTSEMAWGVDEEREDASAHLSSGQAQREGEIKSQGAGLFPSQWVEPPSPPLEQAPPEPLPPFSSLFPGQL